MKNGKGYTLVELIVVMLIFIIVIMITASAFEKVISYSAQLTRSAQSNIEGIIGLELMRADLESTGFGLPNSYQTPISYTECQVAANYLVAGVDPAGDFNDGKGAGVDANVPRAILTKAATSGSDYLVVKSAAVGMSTASKKWSYINYSTPNGIIRPYGGTSLKDNDRVITLRLAFGSDASANQKQLVTTSTGGYYYNIVGNLADVNYSPGDATENYVAYGIYTNSDLSKNPSMPFNRADYFVHRPTGANSMSSRCAQGTGNLYKAPINHIGGGYTLYPLLDCVLDMQVSFIRDINNDGNLTYTNTLAALSAQEIREQVKSIRVSILAQEGGFDRYFTYPQSTIVVGPSDMPSQGKVWTAANMVSVVGSNWTNYRWKVYEVVVQPKNLNR